MDSWYRRDDFLNPKKAGPFAVPAPGNIGGMEPDPKTMADAPGPRVIEIEGTDETDVEREDKAKPGDAVSPVATDDEMYKVNYPSNFRASGEDALEMAFAEPADRGPRVVNDDEEAEEFEMDGEVMKGLGNFGDAKAKPFTKDAFLGGHSVERVWSDEARAAAAEARARNAGSRLDAAHEEHRSQHARSLGWQRADNPDPMNDRTTHYTHPDRPGERLRFHPGGSWQHTGPGGLNVSGHPMDQKDYLTHLHGRTQV